MSLPLQRKKFRTSFRLKKKTRYKPDDEESLLSVEESNANGDNENMSLPLQRQKSRRSARWEKRKRNKPDDEKKLIPFEPLEEFNANEDNENHETDKKKQISQKKEDNMIKGSQQRSSHLEFTKEIRRKSAENEESNGTADQQSGVHYMKETDTIPKSEVRCFECIQAFPVNSAHEIQPGDHVVFIGLLYDHHAIILKKEGEKFTIREATNTFHGAVSGIVFGGKAKIKTSERTFDFAKERICVVKYNRRFSPEVTIRKASETQKEYSYNLFRNNCEHFATECVTGISISVQVSKLRLAWKLFWSSGFVGISDEEKRNEKGYAKGMICERCYYMNKNLLDVEKIPITSKEHINTGDIIRYTYWNLWHEAVVLDIEKTTRTTVKCKIAHYAFCGPFSHRTIQSDSKTIRLDGKCLKLDYTQSDYNVYDPSEVVKRAKESLNEQWFVFFANDSSHFARWCKLKLKYAS